MNITKLILTAILIALSAADLIIAIIQNGEDRLAVATVDFYSPAIKIATFVSKQFEIEVGFIFIVFNQTSPSYLSGLHWIHSDTFGCAIRSESSTWSSNIRTTVPILDDAVDMQHSTATHTN